MSLRRGRRGFVLIELMTVVAVMSILSAVAVPKYISQLERVRAAQCLSNRMIVQSAVRAYMFDRPAAAAPDIATLVQQGFLARVPACASKGVYALLDDGSGDPRYMTVACSAHGYAAPVSTGTSALFSSLFDSMAGLNTLTGSWSVKNGLLIPGTKGEQRLGFGDLGWKDYSLQLNATLTSGSGYGVFYRDNGLAAISGYSFVYDASNGKFVVRKMVNGAESGTLASVKMPKNFPVYNTAHAITISVVGSSHVISVDGSQVLSFTDSTFASGAAGLRDLSGSKAGFDSVAVNPK